MKSPDEVRLFFHAISHIFSQLYLIFILYSCYHVNKCHCNRGNWTSVGEKGRDVSHIH